MSRQKQPAKQTSSQLKKCRISSDIHVHVQINDDIVCCIPENDGLAPLELAVDGGMANPVGKNGQEEVEDREKQNNLHVEDEEERNSHKQ